MTDLQTIGMGHGWYQKCQDRDEWYDMCQDGITQIATYRSKNTCSAYAVLC